MTPFDIIIIGALAIVFVIIIRKIPGDDENQVSNVKKGWNFPSITLSLPKISTAKFNWSVLTKMWKKETVAGASDWRKETAEVEAKKEVPAKLESIMLGHADSLLKQGKIQQAEKIYIDLATKFPNEPKIYSRLGVIYLKQKNYADARDCFLQSLKYDDTEAPRHYNLAMAYIGMNSPEKAKVSLKKALSLDPKDKYQNILDKISGE
ncbi:hypothetical protein CO101_00170 [Candidatus Berkelbacteria bacterium CG_4_9_14_3_um_filter_39_23]|uniref:Uncharacterized protein n=2 Tax=Candidatus Berkelbacteria TaxID=1618330 RepID=A0A2M7CHJ5_9BACT|nr:tetratricopeptide repeat protein [Candidatus Berkelbacteria bacterium]OIP05066.1 MAG: hypothetical protein AUK14_02145 [Candidatus Berkelbacteria bacterium CG2_30_39_44]PIR28190.1 MAG: hypothetical protein COV39_00375 [Candidatus Berkelbacteria bacterium CG11_big_fil_rev_8_21_14_0_20_40_23]PIV25122.1 MAG: hypothetical protein COS38_03300 [Candidatus Berkelbacteria bacterium CG03_land_8_20_14_0_80_40_36]PIX30879.1 MAG: hypothetical protein COZ62_00250 [Candidatus Berkelbacteria bacterium CG_4